MYNKFSAAYQLKQDFKTSVTTNTQVHLALIRPLVNRGRHNIISNLVFSIVRQDHFSANNGSSKTGF